MYRRPYGGLYCVRCERFYAADELAEGRCPEHDVVPEVVEEENCFFRLSRYADRLAELLDTGALRVLPESRQREVRAFVARGLADFSISRSRNRARGWGIPAPGHPDQVIYVWFDALTNYLTALGYGTDAERYRRSWVDNPTRVHVIGKDIVRFHAVYWPAMLLSAGVPPPTTIVVHGFLTRDGRRMSKTLGTGVDPVALAEAWGVDAVRYWLLRAVAPHDDADYTDAGFARTYDADLANDLGNLLQRTVSMLHRYRGGVVAPSPSPAAALDTVTRRLAGALHRALGEDWDPRDALAAVWSVVGAGNRHIDEVKPWVLARAECTGDADAGRRLDRVLGNLAESLRLVAEGLRPLLPDTAAAIARQLGVSLAPRWAEGLCWNGLGSGTRVAAPTPLFPRHAARGGASGVGE